jgi:tRNA A-37 threonylcarbamoyl transferase component Bud32
VSQDVNCPDPRDLERLARGQLAEQEAEQLGQHILACSACAALLNVFQAADPLLRDLQAAPGQPPPEDPLIDGLMERLVGSPPDWAALTALSGSGTLVGAAAAAPPPLPGYDVLDELGRGGQSVVYKARQRALDRMVALKMILARGAAHAEERARFRREAEAVAHLEHPHIVQIYDVGEHAGQPYCALEYASGGTLARKLAGVPLAGREAARLLETLARTMHWAHQRGIVHRDLKPGNVLLTADGTLKITDFGLAKRLEAGAGLTHIGNVLGTPSYMAPEQAAGKTREVGPAADVYALGTIGYEMLTGRPPFLGATAWDIIPQVLGADPVPPRRLQPNVPRDLETICLKCLHKEPHKRYTSAQDLADDLGRFQADQPIKARPVAWLERLLKWVKRRPAVAALTAAVVVIILVGLVTSLALAGWALRERDRANDRLAEAQKADRRRVQAQIDQLGSAAPEAVPGLLSALKEDRAAVLPRLRELWVDETGGRQRRMRAGLALVDDPAVRKALAAWMIEVEDPRELLLVRQVLAPRSAGLAQRLWNRVHNPKVNNEVRFRALVALAAFDPVNPRWREAAPTAVEQLVKANPLFLGRWIPALWPVRRRLHGRLVEVFRDSSNRMAGRRLVAATVLAAYAADRPAVLAGLACDADAEQFAVLRPVLQKNRRAVCAALTAELAKDSSAKKPEAARVARARRQGNAAAALVV